MTSPTLPSAVLAAAFEAEARRLFQQSGVPGASFTLLLPDGDYHVDLGVTNLEHPLPVTAQTFFQIGSTTKTLTSLVCSTLVAEGKLDLDAPVRTYLPDFALQDQHAAEHATVRDLLTHQGGWLGDLFEDTGDGDDALTRGLDKLAESPQIVPLRGHWSYNNSGFFVVGRIIEVLTGQTYEQAVTQRVLKPLGMDHTLFFPNEIMTHRFAAGHNKVGGAFQVQRPWMMMRSAAPAGSTCSSTSEDMAKYAHFIMDGRMTPSPAPAAPKAEGEAQEGEAEAAAPAEPALKQVNRASLWERRIPIGNAFNAFPGELGQMGQSWFVDEYEGATILSHGGTTIGQQSDFWVSPDRHVGFIAMTNASSGHALNRQLSAWVKRAVLGLTPPELGQHEHAEDALADFTGQYNVVGQTYTLQAAVRDGGFVLTIPDSASGETVDLNVRFIEPERAVVVGGDADGLGLEFLRDAQGVVDFMRFGGRLYPRELGGADATEAEPAAVQQG